MSRGTLLEVLPEPLPVSGGAAGVCVLDTRYLGIIWYPRRPLGIKGQSCSSATMIPQMTVVADLTHSEDELSLKPGYAVGDCHALSGPRQNEGVYPVHHMVPKTTPQKQGSELFNRSGHVSLCLFGLCTNQR